MRNCCQKLVSVAKTIQGVKLSSDVIFPCLKNCVSLEASLNLTLARIQKLHSRSKLVDKNKAWRTKSVKHSQSWQGLFLTRVSHFWEKLFLTTVTHFEHVLFLTTVSHFTAARSYFWREFQTLAKLSVMESIFSTTVAQNLMHSTHAESYVFTTVAQF